MPPDSRHTQSLCQLAHKQTLDTTLFLFLKSPSQSFAGILCPSYLCLAWETLENACQLKAYVTA